MDFEYDEDFDHNEPLIENFDEIAKVLIRAVDKHIFLPGPRLKLRAYVYGRLSRQDKNLWRHIGETLKVLMSPNEIGEFIVHVPGQKNWVTLPDYLYKKEVKKEYKDLLDKKVAVYNEWETHNNELGRHLEIVTCNAFSQCGYDTHWNESRSWINKNGKKESIQIDVVAKNDHKFIIEAKNQLSDVIHAPREDLPENLRSNLEDQLIKLFNLSYKEGYIPILVAPFIHESFYGFSRKYNGLALSTVLQLVPPSMESLAKDYKRYIFGNVRACKAKDVPPHIMKWVKQLPMLVEKYSIS